MFKLLSWLEGSGVSREGAQGQILFVLFTVMTYFVLKNNLIITKGVLDKLISGIFDSSE